jgi:hypothetical protein
MDIIRNTKRFYQGNETDIRVLALIDGAAFEAFFASSES